MNARALFVRVSTAVCLIVLTGCAGIPDSGPVTRVKADSGSDLSTVRYSPTGPARDAQPQDIIRGYLDAMLAYPVTTGTAASFLTSAAARSWKSSVGVKVYSEPLVSTPVAKDEASVGKPSVDIGLDLVEDATLDPQGRFARVDARRQFSYHLVQTKGQWRIANPQPGFLVNRKFFDDYYRPFNNYFFDKPGRRLVADPIYLPVGDQLSTALVSSLLLGPKGSLAKTARTYVPGGAALRTSVPLRSDGLADVQFRDDLTALSGSVQERLSAQLVWTLRQVPQVTGVRLTGGDSVLYPGNRGIQSIDSWESFGPRSGDGGFYGVQRGRIVELSGRDVQAVDGPWGKDARKAADIAVDSGQLAVVSGRRSTLTIGGFDSAKVSTYAGRGFLRPMWDDSGKVWVVDRSASATRLRLFDAKGSRSVAIGRLSKFGLSSFALSPDGARYAVTARAGGASQVYVGLVVRDKNDEVRSLAAPTLLRPSGVDFTNPHSISWANPTSVTFLADDDVVGMQIFESRVDGSSSSGGTAGSGPLLPDVDAVALATTGGDDPTRCVTDHTGHVWLLRPGGTWERLDGPGITGLTAAYASSTG